MNPLPAEAATSSAPRQAWLTRLPSARDLEYYRDLIVGIVRTELKVQSFNYMLGQLWHILDPALYALMYFYITAVMFRMNNDPERLLLIFVAVMVWRWFSRNVENAPHLVPSFEGVIRLTNFPAELLLVANFAVNFTSFLLGLLVVFGFMGYVGTSMGWTVVYLPYIIFVQGVFIFFITSFIATIGAFLRDISKLLGVVLSIWWYMSPGIYGAEVVPGPLRPYYEWNPFWTFINAYRAVLVDGTIPDLRSLAFWLGVSVAGSACGLWLFRRSKIKFFKIF